MTEPDLQRFGRLVRARREELGIQQEDMDDHGGPSSTTMSRVERGIAPPSAKTLRKLDAGLQWQQGSSARALEGGDPTPLAASTVIEKPLRQPGQTTQNYPNADVPSLVEFVNAAALAAEGVREMIDDSAVDGAVRERLVSVNAKLEKTMLAVAVACELIGEQLAAEDITDFAELGAFIARLDAHVRQLSAVRDAAGRLYSAVRPYEPIATNKEDGNAVSGDATEEPPASPPVDEDEKMNLANKPQPSPQAETFGTFLLADPDSPTVEDSVEDG